MIKQSYYYTSNYYHHKCVIQSKSKTLRSKSKASQSKSKSKSRSWLKTFDDGFLETVNFADCLVGLYEVAEDIFNTMVCCDQFVCGFCYVNWLGVLKDLNSGQFYFCFCCLAFERVLFEKKWENMVAFHIKPKNNPLW